MDKLKGLSPAVLTSDSGTQFFYLCNKLLAMMEAFEVELMQDWCSLATLVSQQKLNQPVLKYVHRRLGYLAMLHNLYASSCVKWTSLECRWELDNNSPLRVNFEPELDKLLREVHDLLLMPTLPTSIPEPALQLYERSEEFRQQICMLELMVEMYNNVCTSILPVEKDLLLQQLQNVNACLQEGVEVGKEVSENHSCLTAILPSNFQLIESRCLNGTAVTWKFSWNTVRSKSKISICFYFASKMR